jgi:tetratricopeptide (TPR) repeat protein
MIQAIADDGPVLLAFDDLQFLDPASQEVLFLITRGLARVPALILAAEGAGEEPVKRRGRDGLAWSETIGLEPLDRAHSLTLIHDLSADCNDASAPIQETIVRLSQGNPYHIEMLVSDWRAHRADSLVAAESTGDGATLSWTPPADLRAAFARQYGGLSADAQHTLQVLAVAGKALPPREVSSLLGLAGAAMERVVLEMLDLGVGRVEEGRLSFKNELHRVYVYHAMGIDRRTYHHAQLAQRLAASDDRHDLQTMLELVHHSIGAGFEQQAIETGLEAAEVAVVHGAPREAERLLTSLLRAYDVAPGSRLRLLLAHALVAAGEYQRGLDALEEWRGPIDAASATDRALAALIRADALQRARLGGDEAILRAADEAVALAERAGAAAFLVRANYIRLEVGLDSGNDAARADADAVAARIASSDATPECVALANLALGLGALSRAEYVQSVERCTAAAPVLRSLTLPLELRRALTTLGAAYHGLGRFGDATRAFQEAVAVADRCGSLAAIAHSHMLLGQVFQDLAFFESVAQCYSVLWAALETLSTARAWAEGYSNIVKVALVLGSRSEAEMGAERCEEGARRSGLWSHRVVALVARAQVYIGTGRPELAWPLVEEAAWVAGDRFHLLPDAAPYLTLQRQFTWATRGYEAMKSLALPARVSLFDSMVEALELRLLDEAVAFIAGDHAEPGAPVLEEAVATGLLGPLARLMACGVHHPAVPARLEGESAAQVIARVFPHAQRTKIPSSIASG